MVMIVEVIDVVVLLVLMLLMMDWLIFSWLSGSCVRVLRLEKLVLKLLMVMEILSVFNLVMILIVVDLLLSSIDFVNLSFSRVGLRLFFLRVLCICL